MCTEPGAPSAMHIPLAQRRLHAASDICVGTKRTTSNLSRSLTRCKLDVAEWDIVKYQIPLSEGYEPRYALGHVNAIHEEQVMVAQLKHEGDGTWTVSDTEHIVAICCVHCVVQAEYSQRIDPDRISNPHGEHAEDIWQVSDSIEDCM